MGGCIASMSRSAIRELARHAEQSGTFVTLRDDNVAQRAQALGVPYTPDLSMSDFAGLLVPNLDMPIAL